MTTSAPGIRSGAGWTASAFAVAAPVLVLVGAGFAAAAQAPGYDPVRQTFSALANRGATDRWIMTTTLLALGVGYVVVAAALPGMRARGRMVLAVGGVAVTLAGLMPQPAQGSSTVHMVAAGVGWAAFALWPLAASRSRDDPAVDRWSRRAPAVVVTSVLVVLLAWFTVELVGGGRQLGLAERALVVAQTLWPATVALGRAFGPSSAERTPRRPPIRATVRLRERGSRR
ncbi:DUF998 domain-containing protein [Pseudonocardia endophytica]|uniref:Uncharacterized protein DUF998 n=1 Tax=Pseudonocardia endophytica TaxID=401976 RepID=A0A4R1HUX4_PSEEN|nr:DUF998 domain-containing protein [Pseudonocardia endophytica]TCK25173.1 uncharacterized protein DUF998 [Pseudonocardia endophytica]